MEKQPFAFSHMLEAFDFFQRGPTEVVIIGEPKRPDMHEWIKRLGQTYLPNRSVFLIDPDKGDKQFVPEAAIGKKPVGGQITAYVCRDRTCSLPFTSLRELEAGLDLRLSQTGQPLPNKEGH
jgi:uncharacterized protein YyaL (SSP411 family)